MTEYSGVIASFPRSGRGWLCRMVEWVVRDHHGLVGDLSPQALERNIEYQSHGTRELIEHFGGGRLLPHGIDSALLIGVPRLVRTHHDRTVFEEAMGVVPAVLVCRDPIDALVSLFHFRRDHRKAFDGTLSESVRIPSQGPARLARWFNDWAQTPNRHVVSYERLNAETEQTLGEALNFLDIEASIPLNKVVEVWQFEDRRKLSRQATGLRSGVPGAGRDEMAPEDQDYVSAELAKRLSPAGLQLFHEAGYVLE